MWKSKKVNSSKFNSLYTAFLHSIILSEFAKAYIVYDLDAWLRNPTNNSKFTNWLFGATSIVKNSDKGKYVYSAYRITFDSAGCWSFDN